ncbi:MAG: ABC transporter permease [Candidatus Tectomicrobia bacterium]|uniref:ABC transporter permease n=1 Tax=Tectimicrobiota bacterium TaxID=2528274 RepID=A0A932FUX0_UNCTE|nr:ABC transporter permease [Candidatus Tectomicrobia bacterium]
MRFLRLIWKNARRNPLRTFVTLSALFVVMALLTLLLAFSDALRSIGQMAANTRIVTRHRTSLQFVLPPKYLAKLEAMPHVEAVTRANWFGGLYRSRRDFFPQYAVDPEKFSALWPEYHLPEGELRAWKANRTGCIVGRQLARKYGWKVGDKIPLLGTIYPVNLDLKLEGIYTGSHETRLLFHWNYLEELLPRMGSVWIYWIRVDRPENVAETCRRIDATFANSDAATRTEAEAAFNLAFVSMMGNLEGLIRTIGLAVVSRQVQIAPNTTAIPIREGTT